MADRRGPRAVAGVLLAVVALLALPLLSACSGSGTTIDPSGATIIDVRTPSEYAAGHLQGAINIDVTSSDFATRVGALSKEGTYILYCQSGARASQAASAMTAAGFTHVTNAGGIDAASTATGLPIVTS